MDRPLQPSTVPILSQAVWLKLPQDIRSKLVTLFGIKRSSSTETYMGRDSVVRVVSDGHTAEDLMIVTTEKMQELLGTDSSDFYGLFDDIVGNLDSLLAGTFLEAPERSPDETMKTSGEIIRTEVPQKPKRKYTKRK